MKRELTKMLRSQSISLQLLSAAMLDKCDGDSEWLLHAQEVQGASHMLETWAIGLEQELSE